MRWFARIAFFISGLAALTFEIVWLRHLGWALGTTTLALATTTAAYMGGLALGSHLGTRRADRFTRPLAVYGGLEIVIAIVGALIPWACTTIPGMDHALSSALSSNGDGNVLHATLRFGLAFLILAIPTTAMGFTLPVLAAAVRGFNHAPRGHETAPNLTKEVGLLYTMNLAGAVTGAALSGFYLIPTLGLTSTNHVAVGIDLALGAVALAFGLRKKLDVAPSSSSVVVPAPLGMAGILIATGAAAMVLQVLWTRALATALGPSTYAFSAIVCAYLVGLAIGGAIAASYAHRLPSLRATLSATLAFTGLAAWFGITIVDDLPSLLHGVVLDPTLTMHGLVRTEFALAGLSLLPATIGMGTLFPLTLAAIIGPIEGVGTAVGRAYALNTAGNILGSILAVVLFLPAFGVEWGLRIAALTYGVAALALAWPKGNTGRLRERLGLMGLASASLLLLALWPSWNIGRWTVGLYRLSMARAYFQDPADLDTANVIFHKDGLSTTVTVEEDGGVRWIKVNGKIDGSSHGDMPTQVLSGMLPLLIHPSPKDVAVIGCGSCVTVGAALQTDVKSVTLVELEPAVVEAAHLFADVNHEPWKDPRFRLVADDGRNFMMRPGPRFDVIVSEPSNPWMTGAASLFTQEFFTLASTRLADDGLFLQWLQAYELAPERIASVIKTFQSVFPGVAIFSAHPDSNDLLMVGSRAPLKLSRDVLAERFAKSRAELKRAGLDTVDDLLALLLATQDTFHLLPEVALNTDDNALIEFGAPKDLLTFAEADPQLDYWQQLVGKRPAILTGMGVLKSDVESYMALAWGYVRQGFFADAQALIADPLTPLYLATASGTAADDLELRYQELRETARLLQTDEHPDILSNAPAPHSERFARGLALYERKEYPRALELFADSTGLSPADRLMYCALLIATEDFSSAKHQLYIARQDPGLAPFKKPLTYLLARSYSEESEYKRAATEMRAYVQMQDPVLSVASQHDYINKP